MSNPAEATVPAGRCGNCPHFAPVGEMGTCRYCNCTRHTAPPYEPATPAAAEQKLEQYMEQLDAAEQALTEARNAELEAENKRDQMRAAALLSEQCPKVGVFDGVRTTVAMQEAWVAAVIEDYEFAFRAAREVRRAAAVRFEKVRKQGQFQQSINSNARDAARTYGGRP